MIVCLEALSLICGKQGKRLKDELWYQVAYHWKKAAVTIAFGVLL